MKKHSTKSKLGHRLFALLTPAFALIGFLVLTGCSSGFEQNDTQNQTVYSGDKSFSFKENGSNWRVDFEDDEIGAIYKNGYRVPDGDIGDYKEMIYNKIDDLKSDKNKLAEKYHKFHFDADKFNHNMKKFKEDFDKDKFIHFKIEFDEKDFENNMKELEENLKELKDKKIDIYFDSEKLKGNMKELEDYLKNLPEPQIPADIDIDVHIDMHKFKENMKKFERGLKSHNFKFDSSMIDLGGLKESMKELKENMKGLHIEIHDLSGDMEKLNSFISDLKSELVKDGYIKSNNEELDLEMDKDKTEVNGKEVRPEDHSKYLEMYKNYFDKELDGTFKIKRD